MINFCFRKSSCPREVSLPTIVVLPLAPSCPHFQLRSCRARVGVCRASCVVRSWAHFCILCDLAGSAFLASWLAEVCVCVCVACVSTYMQALCLFFMFYVCTHMHICICTHIYIFIYIYICICRSEGFSRKGCLFPARGLPGFAPDGESCWDAAVAAAIWPGDSFCLGSRFSNIAKVQENTFSKNIACPENPKMQTPPQKVRKPNIESQLEAFKNIDFIFSIPDQINKHFQRIFLDFRPSKTRQFQRTLLDLRPNEK